MSLGGGKNIVRPNGRPLSTTGPTIERVRERVISTVNSLSLSRIGPGVDNGPLNFNSVECRGEEREQYLFYTENLYNFNIKNYCYSLSSTHLHFSTELTARDTNRYTHSVSRS